MKTERWQVELFNSILNIKQFNGDYDYRHAKWVDLAIYDLTLFDYINLRELDESSKSIIDFLLNENMNIYVSLFPLELNQEKINLESLRKEVDHDLFDLSFIIFDSNFNFFLINDIDYECAFLFCGKELNLILPKEINTMTYSEYQSHILFLKEKGLL